MSLAFPARYEPCQKLGMGGGGEVWEVRDRYTEQRYALKFLAEDATEHEREALVREATALSGLEGLGVPRVLRFGRLPQNGRPYMVRELIEGQSLEALIAGTASTRACLQALALAAEQLTLLHRAGFFHGDIKPANIIVNDVGGVTLVDLGLAAPWREDGTVAPGLTPRYAAPELLGGKPLTVRAEVYALGVTTREIVERGERSLNLSLIRDLLLVAQTATAVEPDQRYPSADEFANALRRAAGFERPSEAAPSTLIWPIVGIDSTASRLLQRVLALAPGECLDLGGASGSGRSVLLRRLAWSLGVEGYPLIWVDEGCAAHPEVISAEVQAIGPEHPLLLVDDLERLGPQVRALLDSANRAGARVVSVGTLRKESKRFELPALPEATAVELLRRAVPSLTDRVAKMIVDKTGGLPGGLRQFVIVLAGRTIASDRDVEELLSELAGGAASGLLSSDPLVGAQLLLARGRYGEARSALALVRKGDPLVIAVAQARLGVGLGEGQDALKALDAVAEEAASRVGSPEADIYFAWRARALVAVARYADALQVLKEQGPKQGLAAAEALAFAGLAYTHMGDEVAAKTAISQAVQLARELGDARIEGVALACLALVLQRSSAHANEASDVYEQALACAQNASDAGTIGTVQLNLAVLLKVRGDVGRAMELYEAAVDMGRRSGRNATVSFALLGLANADLYLGRLARARTSIEELERQRDTLPVVSRATLLGLQAELFAKSGEIQEAARAYGEYAAAFDSIGKTVEAAEARLESVLVRAQASGPDLEALKTDLDFARSQLLDSHAHRALVCAASARVAALMGDERGARASLDEGLAASREVTQLEWTWQILAARAELEERSGQSLMARRDRLEAVTVLEEIAAKLPRDLREVFWNDTRRRALRAQVTTSLASADTHMARAALSPDHSLGRSKISAIASTYLEQRLARILEINRQLLGELDLDRLSSRVVEAAVELVGAQRGFVILRDVDGSGLTVRSASTRTGDPEHLQFSRSIAEKVIHSGEAFASLNARNDLRINEFASVHRFSLEAVACVPIVARLQDPIGALYVESRKSGATLEAEVPTLQAFADQVALAIETARLVAENQQRATELADANQELRKAQASLKELLDERTERLKATRQKLRETEDRLYGHFGYQDIVGTSESMRRCYSLIDRVKETDVPILITGESGTGKEVAARALHRASKRSKLPFLGVNCGAIPEHLLESELFGHVRGAFTGADRDRKGLLREAQGGTVLLDEIGEMPQKMQAGLLRVLQERKVRPVGGVAEEPVSCRFIFATHRNLRELVEAGKFREDLFYRIHVVELPLPPLRQRLDDIPLLVDHFFGIFAARYQRERKTLTKAALRLLAAYSWPGNIRQLEHVLLNAWVLSDATDLDAEDLDLPADARLASSPVASSVVAIPSMASSPALPGAPRISERSVSVASEPPPREGHSTREASRPAAPPRSETTSSHRRSEKERILDALESCNWNRVKAAELSGIPRRTFYRRLREYNIQ